MCILPSNDKFLEFLKQTIFCIVLIVTKKFFRNWASLLSEKCTPNILVVSTFKTNNFYPKTASIVPFRRPLPAISHSLMFDFKSENYEKIWKKID